MRVLTAVALLCAVAVAGCGSSDRPTFAPTTLAGEASPAGPLPTTPGGAPSADPAAPPADGATSTTLGTQAPAGGDTTGTTGAPTGATGERTGTIEGTVTRACGGLGISGGLGGDCGTSNGSSPGVPDVAVELRSLTGELVSTTRSNADGAFRFQPAPGRYVVREPATGTAQEQEVVAGQTTQMVLDLPAPRRGVS